MLLLRKYNIKVGFNGLIRIQTEHLLRSVHITGDNGDEIILSVRRRSKNLTDKLLLSVFDANLSTGASDV